jgi:hypothetical protein
MKTTKTNTYYVVQGQVDGGRYYDVAVKKTSKAADKVLLRILTKCYPQWRGLDLCFRTIRRIETITTETEIVACSYQPTGRLRSLLAEMFVPEWLPAKLKAKLKQRKIPGYDGNP